MLARPALGRLAKLSASDGQSWTYTYDQNGRPVTIAGPSGEVTYGYDPLDRVQTRLHRDYDDPVGKRIEYDYDIQGNRTAVLDPDGLATTYTYDARNRLDTATTEAGVTRYTYWEDSLLKQIEYPNGTVSDKPAR